MLQYLKFQTSRLFRARNSLTFRQLESVDTRSCVCDIIKAHCKSSSLSFCDVEVPFVQIVHTWLNLVIVTSPRFLAKLFSWNFGVQVFRTFFKILLIFILVLFLCVVCGFSIILESLSSQNILVSYCPRFRGKISIHHGSWTIDFSDLFKIQLDWMQKKLKVSPLLPN